MAKERTIQRKIREAAEARGAMVLKQNMGGRSGAGIPDLVLCYMGRFIALEVKRSTAEEATPAQWFKINRIRRAQGIAEVVGNVAEAIDVLDRVAVAEDRRRRPTGPAERRR